MAPRALIAAAAASAVLAIAGCGGGGGSEEPTTTAAPRSEPTALSKSELISQGDAVCAEVNAAVGSLAGAETEAAGTATQVADLYSGMVESLKGLGRPQEAAGYDEFIGAAEELAEAENQAKLAAERGDSSALATAESNAEGALSAFQSAAAEYGFQECSEGPSELPSAGAAGAGAPSEEGGEAEVEEAAPEGGGVEEAPEAGEESAGGGASPGEAEGGETGGASGGIGAG